ncbi:MAG: hypothetical protein MJA27_36315, partial [Pseudanabaenales cyanobacterium]|nr:hypothetical protein [Pseudanabaenales cyanobacterium]
ILLQIHQGFDSINPKLSGAARNVLLTNTFRTRSASYIKTGALYTLDTVYLYKFHVEEEGVRLSLKKYQIKIGGKDNG